MDLVRDDNDKFIDTDEHKDNVSPSVDLIPLARAANSLRGWQLSSYKGPSISTRLNNGHDDDDSERVDDSDGDGGFGVGDDIGDISDDMDVKVDEDKDGSKPE